MSDRKEYRAEDAPKVLTSKEYLELSERTERKFPDGKVLSDKEVEILHTIRKHADRLASRMDGFKKRIIYDKDNLDEIQPLLFGGHAEIYLHQDEIETVHHALGLVTETFEIFEMVTDAIFDNQEFDIVNLIEEIGDLFWYLAGLIRIATRLKNERDDARELWYTDTMHLAMQKNITKLYQRFGDAFDADRALNRDTDEERKQLEEDQ